MDNVYVGSASGAASSGTRRAGAYETVDETGKEIAGYLRYFNEERPRQGLDNRTPDDVFRKRRPLKGAA